MKLLIYPRIEHERVEQIRAVAGDTEIELAGDEAVAIKKIADADALFGKLTPAMLAAADRLRWVQAPTASLEHYIFPELVAHPLVLTNMRGLYSDVVADHAFGLVIALARHFDHYIRLQQSGRWAPLGGENERSDFLTGPGTTNGIDRAHTHLAGSTLGIVGLGNIGREIARRGVVFGMRVVAVDPQHEQMIPGVERIWPFDQLDALLAESDFVVIAAPHTPDTARLFCRPRFAKMKRSAYLINVGRGAIVVLDDLAAAINESQIAGAGLDVSEIEPLPANHPLWRLENVIITPHVAGYSTQIARRHLQVMLENVQRFVAGRELINVVDKVRWY